MRPIRVLHACWLALVLATAGVPSWAFDDGEAVSRWIGSYYLTPQPQRLGEAVAVFLAEPGRLAHPERLDAPAHFFAVVARSHPQARRDLAKLAPTLSDAAARQFVERVLNGSDRLEFTRPRDPNDLDVAWAHFAATGKVETLRVVAAALDFEDREVDLGRPVWAAIKVKDRAEGARLMRGAAAWSLAKHMQGHPMVRDFLQEELARASSDARRDLLRSIQSGKISLR